MRQTLWRIAVDVGALLALLGVVWVCYVVWTRSRNGEIAYECVVFHACPQVSEPTAK